jgi:hypothetical protein
MTYVHTYRNSYIYPPAGRESQSESQARSLPGRPSEFNFPDHFCHQNGRVEAFFLVWTRDLPEDIGNCLYRLWACMQESVYTHIRKLIHTHTHTCAGVTDSTPRVEFLDCSVYVIRQPGFPENGILVEEMLDPSKYRKYNTNSGWFLGLDNAHVNAENAGNDDLPYVVEEGDEDVEDDEHLDTKVCMYACMHAVQVTERHGQSPCDYYRKWVKTRRGE